MAVINYNSSFKRIYELFPPLFYVYVRRAFGDKLYFKGYIKDIPFDADWLDLIVIEISGGANYYKGQTLKLAPGHPIDYLDIALGDLKLEE